MFLRQFQSKVRLNEPSITFSSIKNLIVRNISGTYGDYESELIEKWKRKFEEEKVPEVETSLEQILEHVVDKEKLQNVKKKKTILLTEAQLQRFEQLCECRVARMPLQYIIGEWDFCDLVLKMVPPVFIPRPETEELVELILQQVDDKITMRFLEVGCGTGAISLALLHTLPKAICVAIDQSELACKLTLENAINLKLNDRIKIFRHRLTDDSDLEEIKGSFDLIVSNPPYVPTGDLKAVEPEISLYEDLRALDGGPDGLQIIKSILKLASTRLRLKGSLWLEVDPSHNTKIQAYLKENEQLNLKFMANYKDMFNKDRFVEIMRI